MWACKKCKRKFMHKNQWHSCVRMSVNHHFKNKPKSRRIFDKLIKKIGMHRSVRVDAVKTAINLGNGNHFGMVYVLKDSIRVEFASRNSIKDKRIYKTMKMGNRHLNFVKLNAEKDVDARLIGWLKEAYS